MTSNSSASYQLSASTRRLFTFFMVLLPVLLVVAFEALLRVVNYDGDLHLVVKKIVNGKEVYSRDRAMK